MFKPAKLKLKKVQVFEAILWRQDRDSTKWLLKNLGDNQKLNDHSDGCTSLDGITLYIGEILIAENHGVEIFTAEEVANKYEEIK